MDIWVNCLDEGFFMSRSTQQGVTWHVMVDWPIDDPCLLWATQGKPPGSCWREYECQSDPLGYAWRALSKPCGGKPCRLNENGWKLQPHSQKSFEKSKEGPNPNQTHSLCRLAPSRPRCSTNLVPLVLYACERTKCALIVEQIFRKHKTWPTKIIYGFLVISSANTRLDQQTIIYGFLVIQRWVVWLILDVQWLELWST